MLATGLLEINNIVLGKFEEKCYSNTSKGGLL